MSIQVRGITQFILVVAILIGAFGLSNWLASLRKDAAPKVNVGEREIVVTTQQVDAVPYKINFKTTGSILARAPLNIVPLVTGKIVEISPNFYAGGTFKNNEVLFTIEPDEFQNEVDRLRALVAQSETALDLEKAESQAAIAEWNALHPNKDVPPLVARKPQLKQAKADLDSSKAQLSTALLNLKRTQYSLPYEGRITEANLEIGQYVTAGSSLGSAYALDGLEIEASLNDQQYGWLRESARPDITVSMQSLGALRKIKARPKRLAAEYDAQTRLTRVRMAPVFKVGNTFANILLPGLFVDIDVVGPTRENVWLLPIKALQEDNKIWILDENMTLRSYFPEIINVTPDYVAAVSTGKSIQVVIGPLPQATQGAKARLKTSIVNPLSDAPSQNNGAR